MGQAAKLCSVVQGVQFNVVDEGTIIRAIILRDALEAFFGAGESPESWIRAYTNHQDTIDSAAIHRHRKDRAASLTVLRADRPEDFRFPSGEKFG